MYWIVPPVAGNASITFLLDTDMFVAFERMLPVHRRCVLTFEQYWTIFLKRWHLVLLCTLLSGLSALLVGLCLVPVYRSMALVQVVVHSGTSQSDINDLLASNQLVQTEAQLATSDPVLRTVAARYPALSLAQLATMVSASPRLNTQLFEIDVQDTNATRAAQLANDVAATLVRQQQAAWQSEDASAQQQLQADIGHTRQQIDDLKHRLAVVQSRQNGDTTAQAAALNDQLAPLQLHYNQWQQALAQLELTEAQRNTFLHIDQMAQPASVALRPDVPLYSALGLLGGFLLGCLAILVCERFDTRIRTVADLQLAASWPVLATLCADDSDPGGGPLPLLLDKVDNLNGEAYRMLRSSLGFMEVDRPLRSILVTSVQTGDGKSTVAANLACYMAKTGKRTLLIDANLRQPSLHRLFNFSAEKRGLSNAILICGSLLSQRSSSLPIAANQPSLLSDPPSTAVAKSALPSLHDCMHAVGMRNLAVMPSGPLPPNPSELFDSRAMQRFFLALDGNDVDVVIFDAPPVLDLSDTCVLSALVDGVLMVVDVQRTQRSAIERAQTLLQQTGARIIGCVLNRQPVQRRRVGYLC
jgi:ATPases involved in chromosome partitioning